MDLGRSGAYNDVADNTRTFTNDRSYSQQRDTSPYGERFSNEIEMNKRESGVYSRFIGSFKQSLNDHHQGSASMSIGKSIKHEDEQIFETEQKTPDSGTYSRNIGSYGDRTTNTDGQSYNNGTIENYDFTRGSKYEQRIHENGIHKTQVGSIRDIDDTDGRMKTYQQRNYECESQPRSNKFFQPLKYVGNTLDTPFEQDEDSLAKSVDSFRQSNPTQPYISKSKNNGTATSTSDHDGNGVPHWAKMMYDTGFTDEYLKQKWPRINLQSSKYQSSGPFVVQNDDDDSRNAIFSSNKDDTKKRTRKTCCVIGLGIVLLIVVAVPIIVIATLKKDNPVQGTTDYYKVGMNLTVNEKFLPNYTNIQSTEFKMFNRTFCDEIDKVYKSTTPSLGANYHGCIVTNLQEGSIEVEFNLYIIGLNRPVASILLSKLNSSLVNNNQTLGLFQVKVDSIQVVGVEKVSAIPAITTIPPETTSTQVTTSTMTTVKVDTTSEITSTSTAIDPTTTTNETTSTTTTMDPTTETDDTTSTTKSDETNSTTAMMDQTTTNSETSSTTTTLDPTTVTDETTSTTRTDETNSTTAMMDQTTTNSETSSTTTTLDPTTVTDETTSMTRTDETNSTTTAMMDQTTENSETSSPTTTLDPTTVTDETTSMTRADETTSTTTAMMDQTTEDSEISSTTTTLDPTTVTDETTSTTRTDETTLTTTAIMDQTTENSEISSTTTTMNPTTVTDETTSMTRTDETNSTTTAMMDQTTENSETSSPTTTLDPTTVTDETISMTRADETTSTTTAMMDQTTEDSEISSTTTTMDPTTVTDETTSTTRTDETTLTTTAIMDQTTVNGETSSTTTTLDPTTVTDETTSTTRTDETNSTTTARMDQTTENSEISSTTTTMNPTTVTDETTSMTITDKTTSTTRTDETNSTTTPRMDQTAENSEISSTTTTMDPTTVTDETTSTTRTDETNSTTTTMDPTTVTDETTSTTRTDETTSTTRTDETSSTTTTMDPTTVIDETTSTTTTDEATSTTATVVNTTATVEGNNSSFAFADMKVALNTTYSSDLNDTSSDEYAAFTKDFCSEINKAYSNESGGFGDDYYGCDVTDITEGSIVVNFRIYCINTANIQLTMEAKSQTILNTHTSNGFILGDVKVTVVVIVFIKFDITIYPGNPPIITTPYVTTKTTTETTDGTLQTTTGYTVSPEDVECQDSTFIIGNRAIYTCSLTITDFDEIVIAKLSDTSLTLATISSNGTITYMIQIDATITYVAGEKVEFTISNISCFDEGTYEITVRGNFEDRSSKGNITVQRQPSAPRLTMHEDQVIDLQFYRLNSENECEAEVGNPPGYLVIEVKNSNSTDYDEIPSIDITYVENTTTPGDCSNTQLLRFGMNYTSAMDNGKIRCRVESSVGAEMMSVEKDLLLIPRDICSCNNVNKGVKRGHPKRCDVYVECRARDYPAGVSCPMKKCRNSIDGTCSSNCSLSICDEAVPQSFCTTPPPSTTTPAPSPHISCNDSISVLLYSGSVTIVCVLNQTATFDLINVTKISTSNLKVEIARISNEGNVNQTSADDNIVVTYTMSVITITLNNASCSDEGVFRVTALLGDKRAIAQTAITIQRQPSAPRLTMHADQVIDLQFYRLNSENECEADVGNPPGYLVIEVQNGNNTDYDEIPSIDITYVKNKTTPGDCSNTQLLKFGMNYTSAMDNGKIRCRVESNVGDEMMSAENDLLLIPRDICSCNDEDQGVKRGHPKRCHVYVECRARDYPAGVLCLMDQCRNSIDGTCSSNCSAAVCDEAVPQSFCTTPPPSTTTPAPSPHISCNDSISVLLYSGSVTIVCVLNQTTTFDLINVTKISTSNLKEEIAQISNDGNVIAISADDNIDVTYTMSVITITLNNASCSDEGVFRVTALLEDERAIAQTALTIQRQPSAPRLTMHADQVIDLQFYRKDSENECEADVGNPPGYLVIEVQNGNSTDYDEIPSIDITYVKNKTTPGDCSNTQLLKFGMNYTSAMDNGKIRCRVESNVGDEMMSAENDLLLIPRDICSCNDLDQDVKRGHPKRCDVYVECRARDYPAGVLCPMDQCRNSIDGTCSSNCSAAVCNEAVPQSFCTTPPPSTTTPAPSPHISCNDSISVLLYSGSVTIVCVLNQTATFDLINVTKISTSDLKEVIAQISNEGNVNQISADDNIVVTYTMSVITITLKNVSCSDGGVFRVAALLGDELAIAQTAITIQWRPSGSAELKLNADQIADLGTYRNWLLHYCEADTGYPGGELKIEILLEGENDFKIFNETQDVVGTDSTQNCINLRRITFGILFTSDMNGAIIRCGVTNRIFGDDVLTYSNNETVSLIPKDFCLQNTQTRSYHQHPTDCTKFVQCERTTTYGIYCQPGRCFGIDSTSYCDDCTTVVCSRPTTQDPDITTQQSGTTLSENSMITLKDMNCTKTSTFIGSGPANITCTFKLTDILIGINVSRKVNSTDSLLASINSDGNLISTPLSRIEIKYTVTDLSTISLEIATMTCAEEGNYMFIANQQGNVTFNGGGSLVAKAKPGKPVLTLNHQTIENKRSGQSTCKGNVGNPPGSISIEVKRANEVNYSKYEGFQTLPIKTPNAECNTDIELKFSHVFTEEWNNAKIRCRVENDETISDEDDINDYISDEDTLILIKDDYCSDNIEYKKHPRGNCAYYVQCANGIIYSIVCQSKLCFDGRLKRCERCGTVNATCNFP